MEEIKKYEERQAALNAALIDKTNLKNKVDGVEERASKVADLQKEIDSFQSNDGDANRRMRRHLTDLPPKCAEMVAMMERLYKLEKQLQLCKLSIEVISLLPSFSHFKIDRFTFSSPVETLPHFFMQYL